jgi:hypothetical protein
MDLQVEQERVQQMEEGCAMDREGEGEVVAVEYW